MRSYRKRRNSKRSSVRARYLKRSKRGRRKSGSSKRSKRSSVSKHSKHSKRSKRKGLRYNRKKSGGALNPMAASFVPAVLPTEPPSEYEASELLKITSQFPIVSSDERINTENYNNLVAAVYAAAINFNRSLVRESSPFRIVLKGGRAYQLREASMGRKTVQTGFDIDFIVHFDKTVVTNITDKARVAAKFLSEIYSTPIPGIKPEYHHQQKYHADRGVASICQLALPSPYIFNSEDIIPFVDVGIGLNERVGGGSEQAGAVPLSYYPPFYEDYFTDLVNIADGLLVQSESSFAMETKHLQRKLQVEAFKEIHDHKLTGIKTYGELYATIKGSIGEKFNAFLKLMESLNKFITRGGLTGVAWRVLIDSDPIEFTLLRDIHELSMKLKLPQSSKGLDLESITFKGMYEAFDGNPYPEDDTEKNAIKDFKDLYEVMLHLPGNIVELINKVAVFSMDSDYIQSITPEYK